MLGYKITTLEEDFERIMGNRKVGQSAVEAVISDMLADPNEVLQESAAVEEDHEELEESPEDVDELKRIKVKPLRGAAKAKAKAYRRKNKSKIKKYAKHYKKSATGKKAIKKRTKIMKRMKLSGKKRPAHTKMQFQGMDQYSNLAEELLGQIRTIGGLKPDVSNEIVAFATLAKTISALSNKFEAFDPEDVPGVGKDSLDELADLVGNVAYALEAGEIDKGDVSEVFEEASRVFKGALEWYMKAAKIQEMFDSEDDEDDLGND